MLDSCSTLNKLSIDVSYAVFWKKNDERNVAPTSQRRRRWKPSSQPPSATGCVGARVLSSVYPRMRLLAKLLALVLLTRSRGLDLLTSVPLH